MATIERKVMTRKIARRMAKEGTATFRSVWPVGGVGFKASENKKRIEKIEAKRRKLYGRNNRILGPVYFEHMLSRVKTLFGRR